MRTDFPIPATISWRLVEETFSMTKQNIAIALDPTLKLRRMDEPCSRVFRSLSR